MLTIIMEGGIVMNRTKRKAINELTLRLISVLEIEYPIEVTDIVEKLGGEIEYIEGYIEGSLEAMIEKVDNSFKIVISKEKPVNRRRFSVAHELGHLFLHMGYIINQDLWNKAGTYRDSVYYRHGYNKEELEANEFAAALLMPEEQFIKIAREHLDDNNCYNTPAIADYFQVSVQSASLRGKWLGIFSWG